MTILCIGDSNTYGYDPRSYLGSRYPEDVRWTGRLNGRKVINAGVNGLSVPRDPSPYVDRIERSEPDLVTVMLGSNDLLEGASAAQTAGRMEVFLTALGKAGRPLLLIAPPVMQRGEWVPSDDLVRESRRLAAEYRALAQRLGCRFADAGEWGVELTYDGVHFSSAGHAAFAQKLEEAIMKAQRNDALKQVFESDRIRFVEVSELLIRDYLIMVNDQENVNRFLGRQDIVATEEQEVEWVRKKLAKQETVFSMIDKESGRFIGNIELMDVCDAAGELGIAITADMQDKGFGTEAVSAMIRYGMQTLGLNTIRLRVCPENARAIRVYEKCGFREYDRTEKDVYMESSR